MVIALRPVELRKTRNLFTPRKEYGLSELEKSFITLE